MNIFITTDTKYRINKEAIKTAVVSALGANNIKSDVSLEVNITSNSKMHIYSKAPSLGTPFDILTYPLEDTNFQSLQLLPKVGLVASSDRSLKLGKITISYPLAMEDAALDGKTVDNEISYICEEGIKHLLGTHK